MGVGENGGQLCTEVRPLRTYPPIALNNKIHICFKVWKVAGCISWGDIIAIYLSIYVSIYKSIYPSIYKSMYLSINLSNFSISICLRMSGQTCQVHAGQCMRPETWVFGASQYLLGTGDHYNKNVIIPYVITCNWLHEKSRLVVICCNVLNDIISTLMAQKVALYMPGYNVNEYIQKQCRINRQTRSYIKMCIFNRQSFQKWWADVQTNLWWEQNILLTHKFLNDADAAFRICHWLL